MRFMTGGENFCAIRPYLSTAAKPGISSLAPGYPKRADKAMAYPVAE
jgi:hypothetical protein